MSERPFQSIAVIAARFGVSEDRIRQQFRDNAADLAAMAAKARSKGRKVNGYTAEQLDEHARVIAARAEEK
jgi:hypothetical protein